MSSGWWDDSSPDVKPIDLLSRGSWNSLVDAIFAKVGDQNIDRKTVARAIVSRYNALVAMNHLAEDYDSLREEILEFVQEEVMWTHGVERKDKYGITKIPVQAVMRNADLGALFQVGTVKSETSEVLRYHEMWYNAYLAVQYELWQIQLGDKKYSKDDFPLRGKVLKRFRRYDYDAAKKMGQTHVLTWFSLFNQLIWPVYQPNFNERNMRPDILDHCKKLGVFEYARKLMMVPDEFRLVKPYDIPVSIMLSGKQSSPGGLQRGDKNDWLLWLYYKHPDMFWLLVANVDHCFSYRNEVWGKQRLIDLSNFIRNVIWHSVCIPLLEVLQSGTCYYGKDPVSLHNTLDFIMNIKNCKYSASLDFDNYGPSTPFATWELGIELMSGFYKEDDAQKWAEAVRSMRNHRIMLPHYPDASWSLNPKGARPMGVIVKHPAYGFVTGCTPHNISGTATAIVTACLCAIRAGLKRTDFHVMCMVDDVIAFFTSYEARKKYMKLWASSCRMVGLKTQSNKTEYVDRAAILMKSFWTRDGGMLKTPSRLVGNSIRREPLGVLNNRLTHVIGMVDKWREQPRLYHKIFYAMAETAPDKLDPRLAYRSLTPEEAAATERQMGGAAFWKQLLIATDKYQALMESGKEMYNRAKRVIDSIPGLIQAGCFNMEPLSIHKWARRSLEVEGMTSYWFQKTFSRAKGLLSSNTDPQMHFIFYPFWKQKFEFTGFEDHLRVVFKR